VKQPVKNRLGEWRGEGSGWGATLDQAYNFEYPVWGCVINTSSLQFLTVPSIQRAKLFIGLGFPYEGPAPLEAISHGCFFLSGDFMKVKPTLRAFTSQNPYAERFISKPHVYTLDMKDLNQVEQAMADIMKEQVSGDSRS